MGDSMHPDLIDQLLFKDEGESLDFKAAQYAFAKVSDHQKAELLKDILAMANAWRDGPGHILIGFKENRPNRATVVGISDHLDDASLQQFVTQKVTPKLQFRYEEVLYEGKHVAVITIPKQKRAFWLTKDFGLLRANIVYVRRGSSTDQASPAEVQTMMNADAGKGAPRIELAALDREFNTFSKPVPRRFYTFEKRLPDFYTTTGPFDIRPFPDNSDYWRELANFIAIHQSVVNVQFEISNFSDFALTETRIEITRADGSAPCDFLAPEDLPERPQESMRSHLLNLRLRSTVRSGVQIEDHGREQCCVVNIGVLRPGQTMQPEGMLGIRFRAAGRVELRMRVLASELASPIEVRATIDAEGVGETLDFEGLRALEKEALARR